MKSCRTSSVVIVIVDDDEPLRRALTSMLEAAGFRVVTFGSAEEFLASSERRTSCLILDVRLPGMSGVELQRRLIEDDQQVSIIFVTAHGDDNLRERLLNSGAKGFLFKPVRREALLAAIGAATGNKAEG